jgi:hypothetical protein
MLPPLPPLREGGREGRREGKRESRTDELPAAMGMESMWVDGRRERLSLEVSSGKMMRMVLSRPGRRCADCRASDRNRKNDRLFCE